MFIRTIKSFRFAPLLGIGTLALGCYAGADADANSGGVDGSGDTGGADSDETTGADDNGDTGPGPDSGDDTTDGPPISGCAAQSQAVIEMFTANCAGCHSPGSGADVGDFDYITDLNRLVASGLVQAGDPLDSLIYRAIVTEEMPQPPNAPLVQADRDLVSDWITECAESPVEQCNNNDEIDIREQLQVMNIDVQQDFDDAEDIRYFTLFHLYSAGFCGDEIDEYRQAISKAANSLSTEAQIQEIEAIDELGLILKIDLTDYGWDEPVGGFANKWDLIVDASPYSVERLEDEAVSLKLFTGSDIPFLQGDAFLEIASVALDEEGRGIYNELVETPNDLIDLQIQLGIDFQDDIDDEEVARAGMNSSAINNHIRENFIVERHEGGIAGAAWVEYLFDDSVGDQSIFEGALEFNNQGGFAVIYPLFNGLHGYFLADAAGNRVDIGDDAVLSDPNADDGNVHTGISCFGCHAEIVAPNDVVREFVFGGAGFTLFNAQERDIIDEIYPERDEMQDLVDDDNARYQNALSQAGVDPFSNVEPVSAGVISFQFNVDRERAAAELGIAEQAFITQIGALDPALSPLSVEGGQIKRDTWTDLFAQTACDLNIGVTQACP